MATDAPIHDLSHLHADQVEFLRKHGYTEEQIARFAPWGRIKPKRAARPMPLLPPEEQARLNAEAVKKSNDALWWH